MKYYYFLLFASCLFLVSCMSENDNPLEGKVICIDPGHGGTAETDTFRVGPTGEREEWVNMRVALKLAELLEESDAVPYLTRSADSTVELKARADRALLRKADVFVSIHHNATADSTVNFPIIYFHGNALENQASVILGKILAKNIRSELYSGKSPVSLVSDHVIFPGGGTAVLRHSYGIPGVIGEASFFTNPDEEARLKSEEYNQREAEAYFKSLSEYFKIDPAPILEKYSTIKLPRFEVFQEAERMDPLALLWREDFNAGKKLSASSDTNVLNNALGFLSRSVKSFPDSWLARQAHLLRGDVLERLQRKADADTARLRAKEFYVEVD